MRINQAKWTTILLIVSVAILGLEYDVISFKDANINISIITINEFKINKPHVLEVIALAILVISVFIQLKYTLQELRREYSKGYKNISLAEFVTNYIANLYGHSAHGAPYGDLKPGLFKKAIKPGSGRLTEGLSIELPTKVHLKSVLSGLLAVVSSKFMYIGVVPILIGIWSITVIVI